MKKVLAVFLALACVACTVVTKVNIPDMATSDWVTVSDLRPATEKESRFFSLSIVSKQYGIYRVGDARLSPPAVKLLQYEVAKQWHANDGSPTVNVYHLVIYMNTQSETRREAASVAVGGALGAVIGDEIASHNEMAQTRLVDEKAFDGLATEEYQRGLYSQAENPKKTSVYIVYIDTDIDGKRVFTRTIAAVDSKGNEDPLADAIELAIRNHLAKYQEK